MWGVPMGKGDPKQFSFFFSSSNCMVPVLLDPQVTELVRSIYGPELRMWPNGGAEITARAPHKMIYLFKPFQTRVRQSLQHGEFHGNFRLSIRYPPISTSIRQIAISMTLENLQIPTSWIELFGGFRGSLPCFQE